MKKLIILISLFIISCKKEYKCKCVDSSGENISSLYGTKEEAKTRCNNMDASWQQNGGYCSLH